MLMLLTEMMIAMTMKTRTFCFHYERQRVHNCGVQAG